MNYAYFYYTWYLKKILYPFYQHIYNLMSTKFEIIIDLLNGVY